MKKLLVFIVVIAAAAAFLLLSRAPETGRPPLMHGVNLGSWLADEFSFGEVRFDCDSATVFEQLRDNIGIEYADRLLAQYRDALITAEDFTAIRDMGFNAVRLPISAAHLYDQPGSTERFDRMAERIDWALWQAHTNSLSLILNLRVRAGEWASQPAFRGRRFKARWSERDVEEVARLWGRLVDLVKDQPSLAGYDLSTGSCGDDVDALAAFRVWTSVIEEKDPGKMIMAPWPRPARDQLRDEALASPRGFAADMIEHAVRSDDRPSELRQALENDIQYMDAYWAAAGLSRTVTEFNPALIDGSGRDWFGTYRTETERLGWHSMLWTYRAIAFSNNDPGPYAAVSIGRMDTDRPDFSKASMDDLVVFFAGLKDLSFDGNTGLLDALAGAARPDFKPAAVGGMAGKTASSTGPGGWSYLGAGGVDCSIEKAGDNGLTVTASGLGVNGRNDNEFGYVYQEVNGGFGLSAALTGTDLKSSGAGAGFMVRSSIDPSSPFLAVYQEENGTVVSLLNNANGQPVTRRVLVKKPGYHHLRVMTDGKVLKASCSTDGRMWPVAANFSAPWITNRVLAGAVVFSGNEYRAAQAVFDNLSITSGQ